MIYCCAQFYSISALFYFFPLFIFISCVNTKAKQTQIKRKETSKNKSKFRSDFCACFGFAAICTLIFVISEKQKRFIFVCFIFLFVWAKTACLSFFLSFFFVLHFLLIKIQHICISADKHKIRRQKLNFCANLNKFALLKSFACFHQIRSSFFVLFCLCCNYNYKFARLSRNSLPLCLLSSLFVSVASSDARDLSNERAANSATRRPAKIAARLSSVWFGARAYWCRVRMREPRLSHGAAV